MGTNIAIAASKIQGSSAIIKFKVLIYAIRAKARGLQARDEAF